MKNSDATNLDKSTLIRTVQECMTNETIDYCQINKIDPTNPSDAQAQKLWYCIFQEEIAPCNHCGDFFNKSGLRGLRYEKELKVCENCYETDLNSDD